jgi:glycosyltransferase involved in cell wall biosynthesis
MKVLIINQHISDVLGGSEMQCDLIARGLAARGHKVVYVAVGKKRKDHYSNDLPYNVEPIAIEKKGELLTFLNKLKPDVVYWRYNKNVLLRSTLQIRKANIPLVFAVSHVNDVNKFVSLPRFDNTGLQSVVKFLAKTVVYQLKSIVNYQAFQYVDAITLLNSQYAGKLPVQHQKVIWNSVTDKTESFEWKRPYCLWVANIKSSKRPEAFIQLAKLMSHRRKDIDFLMVGAIQDDNYRDIIQGAEKLSNFYYLGSQRPEFVNGALAKATCLVHTCKPEGFGNNFIQAWMQGCPTVSLEFDPDNLIQNQRLGFISGTLENMVNNVERLIKDRKLRNEIGNRAQVFARIYFHPERMVTEVEQFLTEVVTDYKVKQ